MPTVQESCRSAQITLGDAMKELANEFDYTDHESMDDLIGRLQSHRIVLRTLGNEIVPQKNALEPSSRRLPSLPGWVPLKRDRDYTFTTPTRVCFDSGEYLPDDCVVSTWKQVYLYVCGVLCFVVPVFMQQLPENPKYKKGKNPRFAAHEDAWNHLRYATGKITDDLYAFTNLSTNSLRDLMFSLTDDLQDQLVGDNHVMIMLRPEKKNP